MAAAIRGKVTALQRIEPTATAWDSDAADNFVALRDALVMKLPLVASRFRSAASALRDYESNLADAQATADLHAENGRDALDAYQGSKAELAGLPSSTSDDAELDNTAETQPQADHEAGR